MALANEVQSSRQELLDAQAHVWNHIFNYINSMSLKCAIQLGIPDVIHKHGKPMTLSQLANDLSINEAKSHGLFRLMRILVHSKFFTKVVKNTTSSEAVDVEAYCLTGASRLLLRDEPLSLAPLALAMLDPIFIDQWHHLSEWFGNNLPTPLVTKYGRSLWEHTAADKEFNVLFNEAMACDAGLLMQGILTTESRRVFQDLKSLVDVGGGTGATAKGIAAAFPGLKCVVMDLPHVVAGLEGSQNLSYVSGDMFDFIPAADAVFLKWILHDWNADECVKILEKCKEAISNSSGKVIVVEMVMEDEREEAEATETKLFFDLQMMSIVTGKERTEKEWAKIFFAAGFKNYKITPVLGLRSVIEIFP